MPTDIENPMQSLHDTVACDSRDWSTARRDAWIYGIVCGWDCDPSDLVEGEKYDDAMKQVAKLHNWDDATIARLRRLHAKAQEMLKL